MKHIRYIDWLTPNPTWSDFKDSLSRRCRAQFSYMSKYKKAVSYSSGQEKTYFEYCVEKNRLLQSVFNVENEENRVAIIIDNIEERSTKSYLTGLMIKTVDSLCDIISRFEDRKLCSSDGANKEKKENQDLYKNNNRRQKCANNSVRYMPYGSNQKNENDKNTSFGKRSFYKNESGVRNVENSGRSGCYLCGSLEHFKNNCPKNCCDICKRKGHTAEKCFSKPKVVASVSTPSHIVAAIGGHDVNLLIDTGSEVTLIKKSVAIKASLKIFACHQMLSGFDGNIKWTLGKVITHILLNTISVDIEMLVVADEDLIEEGIIGRDFLFKSCIRVLISDNKITLKAISANIFTIANQESCKYLSDLAEVEHINRLANLINEFKIILATGSKVGTVTSGELLIRLSDDTPIVRNPYRMSIHERENLKVIIATLLENGIIQNSESPYASPIKLVTKKNGESRMCVDFRALNAVTIKDRYPLPLIEDQLDSLASANWFTSLDMASGFYQIPVAAESVFRTSFVTPDGQYEFLRMPFGLTNAPAVFQRAIHKALKGLYGKIAYVYIDDILIPSTTIDEGFTRLKTVLVALKKSGFSLNIKKCKFFVKKVEYLGRIIENGTIKPSSIKTDALKNSPVPTNIKQVRQFLGLAGYFRKFIENFSTIVSPISSLLKKDAKWNWSDNCEKARLIVVEKLTTCPILCIYESERETELHTDASSVGIGAALMQKHETGFRVVAYYSKKFSLEESKYHSYEQETLAIILALKHFRVYLIGKKIRIVTDCNAVKATATKKDILPRVARWWVYLQDFDYEIVYRPGKKVSHVDYLSRNHPNVSVIRKSYGQNTWLKVEQDRDHWVQTCKDILINNDICPETKEYFDNYKLQNDVLYRKVKNGDLSGKRWYVPKLARWRVMRMFHDEMSHLGYDRMIAKLGEICWFPKMNQVVRKYVQHCLDCAHGKCTSGKRSGLLYPIEKIPIPFDTIHLDHVGPMEMDGDGYKFILTLVDAFTKFVILTPTKNVDVETVIITMESIIDLFGLPRRIIADRGSAFMSKTFDDFCMENGIEKHLTATAMPRANGQVERYHKTILSSLCTMVKEGEENKWSTFVKKLQADLNATQSKATLKSPIELLMGYKSRTRGSGKLLCLLDNDIDKVDLNVVRMEAKRLLDKNQSYNKIKFDEKRVRAKKLKVGDVVLIDQKGRRNKKLAKKFRGPYKVHTVLPNDRYELLNVDSPWKKKPVMAFESLRIWPEQSQLDELMSEDDDEESSSIVCIILFLLDFI